MKVVQQGGREIVYRHVHNKNFRWYNPLSSHRLIRLVCFSLIANMERVCFEIYIGQPVD